MTDETRAFVLRVVFALIAIGIALAALKVDPVLTISRDFAIGILVAGLAVGGVNIAGTIAGARETARIREMSHQARLNAQATADARALAPTRRTR